MASAAKSERITGDRVVRWQVPGAGQKAESLFVTCILQVSEKDSFSEP